MIPEGMRIFVTATGAGIGLQQSLWATPGASSYLSGCAFPYSKEQIHDTIGYEPYFKYSSFEMAIALAQSSFMRACDDQTGDPCGVGIAASVATNREKRGECAAYVCTISASGFRIKRIEFAGGSGAGNRLASDEKITQHVLDMLGHGWLEPNPSFSGFDNQHFTSTGLRKADEKKPGLYFPATFNPIHDGHRAMRNAAEIKTGLRATYLISADPPHKPKLSIAECLKRVSVLKRERWRGVERDVIITTGEPLFIDKARARPGSAFIIGADAMQAIVSEEWGCTPELLKEFSLLGTRFLVMGREIGGEWTECRDVPVRWPNGNLFQPLSGRYDISSTEIREAKA